jgi:hypothetical protein
MWDVSLASFLTGSSDGVILLENIGFLMIFAELCFQINHREYVRIRMRGLCDEQ